MLNIKGTTEQAEKVIYDFFLDLNLIDEYKFSLKKYQDYPQLGRDKPPSRYQLYRADQWIGYIEIRQGRLLTSVHLTPFYAPHDGDLIEKIKENFRMWYAELNPAVSVSEPTPPQILRRDNSERERLKDRLVELYKTETQEGCARALACSVGHIKKLSKEIEKERGVKLKWK